jgi:hypothetical protein
MANQKSCATLDGELKIYVKPFAKELFAIRSASTPHSQFRWQTQHTFAPFVQTCGVTFSHFEHKLWCIFGLWDFFDFVFLDIPPLYRRSAGNEMSARRPHVRARVSGVNMVRTLSGVDQGPPAIMWRGKPLPAQRFRSVTGAAWRRRFYLGCARMVRSIYTPASMVK